MAGKLSNGYREPLGLMPMSAQVFACNGMERVVMMVLALGLFGVVVTLQAKMARSASKLRRQCTGKSLSQPRGQDLVLRTFISLREGNQIGPVVAQ
jgi:hypothetical protein